MLTIMHYHFNQNYIYKIAVHIILKLCTNSFIKFPNYLDSYSRYNFSELFKIKLFDFLEIRGQLTMNSVESIFSILVF